MRLFLYRPDFERLSRSLKAFPGLEIAAMDDERAVRDADGAGIDRHAVAPVAAYASSGLYTHGPVRAFFGVLRHAGTLRWLQSGGAGFDAPIFRVLAEGGALICNSNAAGPAVADYVMAGVIEAFHPFARRRAQQRGRQWSRLEFRELSQTRWLVVGMGHIGRAVAERARGFGAHVTGVRRTPPGDEPADAMIGPAALASALPDSDVVVLTAPLTDETRGMADAAFLGAMKAGSVLVNVARGGLVDEAALLAALDRGRPAHAVLDVFEEEPLPAWSRFWSHPRVLMSAHCAAASPGTARRNDALFLENLDRFLAGRPLGMRDRPGAACRRGRIGIDPSFSPRSRRRAHGRRDRRSGSAARRGRGRRVSRSGRRLPRRGCRTAASRSLAVEHDQRAAGRGARLPAH